MEQIRTPRAAKRLTQERRVIVHAEAEMLARIAQGQIDAFRKLDRRVTREGFPLVLVSAGSREAAVLDLRPDDVRLICTDHPAYAPNTLHLRPGPIWGFWYLDEMGSGPHSSQRFAQFCADDIDADKAKYFFDGVTGYMLRENLSHIPQEVRVHSPLQGAKAVVFCQRAPVGEDMRYLTNEEMIRITAEHDRDALVYVKLHPHQSKPTRRALMEVTQDYTNVRLSQASLHDLIEASDLVVTQNSTAGFEALMQRCAVVTCGKSDYWHATLTARRPADLREALSYGTEAMAEFPYEKYLYWFLGQRLLEPAKDNFTARAWARIRDKGLL